MTRFEELLKEENLKPKYEMQLIDKDNQIYDELGFTSLTDFYYFLRKKIHVTEDEIKELVTKMILVKYDLNYSSSCYIRIINIETNEIVFNSKDDD